MAETIAIENKNFDRFICFTPSRVIFLGWYSVDKSYLNWVTFIQYKNDIKKKLRIFENAVV
jgi:hypothetical protein